MEHRDIPAIKRYKEQARRLREFLRVGGIEIKHTHALEAVAKMHGAKDFHMLCYMAENNKSSAAMTDESDAAAPLSRAQ